MLGSGYLPLTFSLGHLSPAVRPALLGALCQSIRRDRGERGPDAPLLLLGTALGYCQGLLEDAPGGELADLAQAQVGDELRLLMAALVAARHRPGPHRRAAALLLQALFPDGEVPTSLAAVQGLVSVAAAPELQGAAVQVGCAQHLRWVEEAAARLERSLQDQQPDPQRWRARQALRGADCMLRRLVGYVVATTDPADEEQRERARALLMPLEEALQAAPAGASPAVYSTDPAATLAGEAGRASSLRIDRTLGWPAS